MLIFTYKTISSKKRKLLQNNLEDKDTLKKNVPKLIIPENRSKYSCFCQYFWNITFLWKMKY